MTMANSLLDRIHETQSDRRRSRSRRGRKDDSRAPSISPIDFYAPLAADAAAGSSTLKAKETEEAIRPRIKQKDAKLAHDPSFTTGDEYIAFGSFSGADEDSPPASGKAADKRNFLKTEVGAEKVVGKKRRWEEIDANEGYASKKRRVDSASRRCPWAADVDWEGCRNVAEMLHKEVEAFLNYVSPTQVEHDIRSMTVQLISKCIESAFPDASVHPFGSYGTKLYLPSGDIDLVIQSRLMEQSNKANLLKTLASIVRRSGITDRVTIIAKAKVPIVKFVTTHGRFSVDISINQTNGIAAGEMINRFLEEMPALRAIVLVIKSFLNQRSMNEVFSGGLGSYSIVCLAVSFLQMHPKLRRGEIDPKKNLGVLVMEFFEFYGRYFNYSEAGISLRHGGTYFSKARRGWLDNRKPALLSIEDPNDTSNDISRGTFAINNVRQTLAGAFEILSTTAYMRAGVISARQEKRMVSLRSGALQDRLVPEEMSILSSVMGITQETINHRRLVQEVYDKGTLHRLVGVSLPETKFVIADDVQDPEIAQRRVAESRSILSAWSEADMEQNSDEDVENTQAHAFDDTIDDRYESDSRYDIVQGSPSRKRRRMGTTKDSHVIFTADEDEDDHSDDPDGNSLAQEEIEYDVLENDPSDVDAEPLTADTKSTSGLSAAGRRAYWMSKGIDMGSE